jgi:molybdate transport system substrate-binding protein
MKRRTLLTTLSLLPHQLHLHSMAIGVATVTGAASAQTAPAKGTLRVAAASDLQFALQAIAPAFEQASGWRLVVTLGSSGQLAQQIAQGLPADVFMSADEALTARLATAALTQNAGALYGLGRVVWVWGAAFTDPDSALDAPQSAAQFKQQFGARLLAQINAAQKFSIANPEHAPYGLAAKQALTSLGLWEAVQGKLVMGENIAQATQFVSTGAAQAGISALPLLRAKAIATRLKHLSLPADLHAPLRQRMVALKRGGAGAQAFVDYMQSSAARALLAGFGFDGVS